MHPIIVVLYLGEERREMRGLPPFAYLYALFRLDKAGQSLLVAAVGWILIWLSL